ncbi:hypothetical protein [Flavobacterium sp. N2038]|uniref:hypothetical protein n=1 Tax=Flavobacterium sp. N2038 TaxID=2986829 RepID=UPI0022243197|nr:hypothetical protein [Flavobacterium sp. N2038]
MRTIKIYCKECEIELTDELVESNAIWEYDFGIMPENHFFIRSQEASLKNSIIVPIDNYKLKDHPDMKRFQGCCGSSGLDGMNKLCFNGHEVATEFSDCWTDDCIEFSNDKVVIKEKIGDNIFKELKL